MRLLNSILTTPTNIAHSKADLPTIEEQKAMEYENFKTDAGATIVAAMGSMVSGLALNTANIFSTSNRSEIRQKYNLLHDYTQERDLLGACTSITTAVRKYERTLGEFVSGLSYASRLSSRIDTDAGDSFMDRCDACDEEFSPDYEAIRKAIFDKFKPLKCSDPMALYRLMYAIFLSRRFNAVADYIELFSQGFGKGEPLHLMTRLRVTEPLQNLLRRCNLTNKDGQPFIFLFTKDERLAFDQEKQKKSWQKRYEGKHPVEVDVWKSFSEDDIVMPVWRFETHLMELKTIDRLVLKSEGHDPEYRNDYRMKRIQSCAETYEQSMLVSTICCYRWTELPQRMRKFVDSLKRRPVISQKRKPQPVVCFDIKKHANGDVFMSFRGIWNSTLEAEREMEIKSSAIRKSIRNCANDGFNHTWMTLDKYCALVYKTMLVDHPEIASELKELFPEMDMDFDRILEAS